MRVRWALKESWVVKLAYRHKEAQAQILPAGLTHKAADLVPLRLAQRPRNDLDTVIAERNSVRRRDGALFAL